MLQYGAGGNVQKGTSLNTAKLDAETEELKHKTVDLAVGKVGNGVQLPPSHQGCGSGSALI
jgi:hypothetical protein